MSFGSVSFGSVSYAGPGLVTVNGAETGSGLDVVSLVSDVPASESGTGADVAAVVVPETQVGFGIEEQVVLARPSESGTGSGDQQTSAIVETDDAGSALAEAVSIFLGLVDSGLSEEDALASVLDMDFGQGRDRAVLVGPHKMFEVGDIRSTWAAGRIVSAWSAGRIP